MSFNPSRSGGFCRVAVLGILNLRKVFSVKAEELRLFSKVNNKPKKNQQQEVNKAPIIKKAHGAGLFWGSSLPCLNESLGSGKAFWHFKEALSELEGLFIKE